MTRALPFLLLAACAGGPADDGTDTDAVAGVGVRTIPVGERLVEVWYPSSDPVGTDTIALVDHVPAAFTDRVGPEFPLPSFDHPARRDATAAEPTGPDGWPVLLFSHGFGGFRTQSASLCAEAAAQGYVVVSTDHPGRTLGDIVPCLLDPPAGDCQLAFPPDFDGEDPALDDLAALADWLDQGAAGLDLPVDPDRWGLFGHSAGGGSTSAFASQDPRIDAALALAGAGTFTRSLPSGVIGGSCDGIVAEADLQAVGPSTSDGYWSIPGAGHLAFSDLCAVDLGALADELEARDDANGLYLFGLRALAVDGCPDVTPRVEDPACEGAFLPLARTDAVLEVAVPAFFDAHLKGAGDGLGADLSADLVRR
ncbi:MAG: hypothetical protein H6732_15620 [Alphaproteobacteria bacterium]|nr:hypothetical protein [Alphaproteobacteria bacterium]